MPSPNLAKTLKVKMTETNTCFKTLTFKPQELPPLAQRVQTEGSAPPQRSLSARTWAGVAPSGGGHEERARPGGAWPAGRRASAPGLASPSLGSGFRPALAEGGGVRGWPPRWASDKHAHAHMLAITAGLAARQPSASQQHSSPLGLTPG